MRWSAVISATLIALTVTGTGLATGVAYADSGSVRFNVPVSSLAAPPAAARWYFTAGAIRSQSEG